jgi:putative membrane protein
MNYLVAFIHHLAAFALVAALVVEFVLVRGPIDFPTARRLQRTDAVFGLAATVLVVAGLVRVFFVEKGASYYFSNGPFLIKLGLFIAVGLVSIYPTKVFLSWRKATRASVAPQVDAETMMKLKRVIHLELAGIVVIILCAILMARGVGSFR